MILSIRSWTVAGLLIVALATGTHAAALAVYVSPAGNDAWSGATPEPNAQQTDGPVASPQRARDLARAMKERGGGQSVHIILRGGTYFVNDPLELTPVDSGSAAAQSVWEPYGREHPVISGGRRIAGWKQTTVNGQAAWMAKVPEQDAPPFRELWLDGKRLQRARWPKRGTLVVESLSDGAKHDDWTKGVAEFRYAGDDVKGWPTATDAEAIVASRWLESHLPITSIDEQTKVLRFAKRSVFLIDPGDRYWIENVKECLIDPGEFYVDPREKAVYLIPPAGVDPNQAQVIAPRLAQVLQLTGDPHAGKFVEYVNFRGIGFANTEWYFDHATVGQQAAAGQPDPTLSGFGQAAIGVPAAVSGFGVRSCLFEACDISNVGTYGFELSQGCQKNRISRCSLTDLGAGGVKIGDVAVRDNANEQTVDNDVSDCIIADGGHLFPSCVAVWIGQSSGNLVAHNDIHGFWYTGISIGWTWGYGKAAGQRNLVEYNHVHHIGRKRDDDTPILSDMAGIYTLGNQEGTVIRFNQFHDIAARKYGGWGIYFDEGTTHILAENNLVYRTTHGGFHQHYGKENIVRNNIFAFGRDFQIQRTRVEEHVSFTFEKNIVLSQGNTLLGGDWSKLNVVFDRNTYWRMDKGEIRFADKTWQQWQDAGMDKHGKIADPHLADPLNGDFGVTEESKATLAGFEPFDLSKVGPR